ncbi:hypothetical protein [Bradyrhizobium sp.]|uniref:hypothetical protein n=1 Tax=Bradyrhizobium sp. TaxID=376 RepID=UPI003C7727B5
MIGGELNAARDPNRSSNDGALAAFATTGFCTLAAASKSTNQTVTPDTNAATATAMAALPNHAMPRLDPGPAALVVQYSICPRFGASEPVPVPCGIHRISGRIKGTK